MILNVSELLAVVRKDIYIVRRAWHSMILYLPFIKKNVRQQKPDVFTGYFMYLKRYITNDIIYA
jgi:hypothetical protein